MKHPATIRLAALALATLAVGCVGARPPPFTLTGPGVPLPAPAADDSIYIGLAFSGGGHRASAFAVGVLQELAATGAGPGAEPGAEPGTGSGGLAANVGFVTGVSGGAVTATWFALQGPEGLPGFRARYLLQDAGRYLENDPYAGEEILDRLEDGIDGRDSLGRVLDESLFAGATFADLDRGPAITLGIVASDVALAAPFVFDRATFASLCRDLNPLPLSEAVAASAAFPGVFRPAVLPAHRRPCPPPPAPALTAPGSRVLPVIALLARAQALRADPGEVQGVQLLDGGLSDLWGTSALVLARATATDGTGPMTPRQAVRVRDILFLGVDATSDRGRLAEALSPGARTLALTLYGIPQRVRDAGGGELDLFRSGRAIRATTTQSPDTLRAAVQDWQRDLIVWRCALPVAEVARLLGRPADGWDCRDLTVSVGVISPADLPRDMRRAVEDVPTRLRLPPEVIDMLIAGGRQATRQDPALAAVLRRLAAWAAGQAPDQVTDLAPVID